MSDKKFSEDEKRIEALLVERVGYERRGLTERLEAVDAELRRLGYKKPEAPKGRGAKPRRTAD